jgi:hypothetical protein
MDALLGYGSDSEDEKEDQDVRMSNKVPVPEPNTIIPTTSQLPQPSNLLVTNTSTKPTRIVGQKSKQPTPSIVNLPPPTKHQRHQPAHTHTTTTSSSSSPSIPFLPPQLRGRPNVSTEDLTSMGFTTKNNNKKKGK